MPCPLARRCYFYYASQQRREKVCNTENVYKYCIVYTVCKDFKNPYECSRAIYLYDRYIRNPWW